VNGRAPTPAAAVSFDVKSEYDVAGAVGGVARFCSTNGANAVLAAHVATAASELANNLWLYAERGGELRLRVLASGARRGIELVAEDDGPGIAEPALAMTEGWSSRGGMGCGLPGVQRLMDEFELCTQPGRGTRVVTRKWWQPQA